jgi:hypothetical protein
MKYDVFFATGVCVDIPDEIDADTPDGTEQLKRAAAVKFVDAILHERFDITFEPYEE